MTMSKGNGFGKFLVGAGIGAGLTALFTTKKGQEYQKQISDICEDLINQVKDIDVDEVKENVTSKVKEIKHELKDLDQEKVEKIAKKKAKEIEEKTEELVNYAIEKGTPVVKETAESLRKEAIKATKKVLKKLESVEED